MSTTPAPTSLAPNLLARPIRYDATACRGVRGRSVIRMPRPQPTHPHHVLSVKVRADGLAALDTRAAALGVSRSDVVKDALALWLSSTTTEGGQQRAVERITERRRGSTGG